MKKMALVSPKVILINQNYERNLVVVRKLFDSAASEEIPIDENSYFSIYLRLRPSDEPYSDVYRVNDNTIEVKCIEDLACPNKDVTEKQFSFTKIFDEHISQKLVYDRAVYPCLKDVLVSTGATFLTYGTSGSGKTHTTVGTIEDPGVIPRAICQLFTQFDSHVAKVPLMKTDFK